MASESRLSLVIEAKNFAKRTLRRVGRNIRGFTSKARSRFRNMRVDIFSVRNAIGALAGAAGIGAVIKKTFDLGAEIQETASKYRTVFGPAVGQVNEQMEELARRAGLTDNEYRSIAATSGDIIQGFGASEEVAADFATTMTELAADMASFNNVPIEETSRAVQSALTGEREQLKRLGVVIRETDVQERALVQTGKERAEQLTQLEKAEATVALIRERMSKALGDLDRTANQNANTMRRVKARFRQLRDEITVGMMPALGEALDKFEESDTFEEFAESARTAVADVIGAVASLIEKLSELRSQLGGTFVGDALGIDDEQIVALENTLERKVKPVLQDIRRMRGEDGELLQAQRRNIQSRMTALGFEGLADKSPEELERMLEDMKGMLEQDISEASQGGVSDGLVEGLRAAEERIRESASSAGEAAGEAAGGGGGGGGGSSATADDAGLGEDATEALEEYEDAQDRIAMKSEVLGDAFDKQEAKADALKNVIDALTEAGVDLDEELNEQGLTLEDLGDRYEEISRRVKRAEEEQEAYEDAQKRVNKLIENARTPTEEYAHTVKQLNRAFLLGRITADQWRKALDAANKKFLESGQTFEESVQEMKENLRTFDQVKADILSQFTQDFANAFSQAAQAAVTGSKSIGEAFKGAMLNAIASVAGAWSKFYAAKAAAAIGEGLLTKDPSAFAAAAKFTAASAAFGAIAGALRGMAQGGGAPAGGTSTGAQAQRDVGRRQNQKQTTIIVKGGLINLNDPKQRRQLEKALGGAGNLGSVTIKSE